jgi:hypothetical protein
LSYRAGFLAGGDQASAFAYSSANCAQKWTPRPGKRTPNVHVCAQLGEVYANSDLCCLVSVAKFPFCAQFRQLHANSGVSHVQVVYVVACDGRMALDSSY